MSFNPHVQDRRGELTMQAMSQIADANYRGAVAGAQGMASGVESAGQSLAGAGMQFLENLAKQRNNLGKMEAMAEWFPGEQLDTLAKIKDPDKLAGALAVAEDGLRMRQRQDLMEREYGLRAGMAEFDRSANRTGQVLDIQDPLNPGKPRKFIYSSDNSIVPLDRSQTPRAPKTLQTADAILQFNEAGGVWEPLIDPTTNEPAKPNRATDPFASLLGGDGQPQVDGAPEINQGAPPAAQGISAAEASRLLGRPVQPGQTLRDRNGNVVTVQ